jgi:hypothetical protein
MALVAEPSPGLDDSTRTKPSPRKDIQCFNLYILHLYTFALSLTTVLATLSRYLGFAHDSSRAGLLDLLVMFSVPYSGSFALSFSSRPSPSVGAIMVYARYPGHLFLHDFMEDVGSAMAFDPSLFSFLRKSFGMLRVDLASSATPLSYHLLVRAD